MVRKLWEAVVPHSPYSPVAHGNIFLLHHGLPAVSTDQGDRDHTLFPLIFTVQVLSSHCHLVALGRCGAHPVDGG